jgi:hypothetical protein
MEEQGVKIKKYQMEPPVLEQCLGCISASFERFEPSNCPEIKNVRTVTATCSQGQDPFAEGACSSFQAGSPQHITSLPIVAG